MKTALILSLLLYISITNSHTTVTDEPNWCHGEIVIISETKIYAFQENAPSPILPKLNQAPLNSHNKTQSKPEKLSTNCDNDSIGFQAIDDTPPTCEVFDDWTKAMESAIESCKSMAYTSQGMNLIPRPIIVGPESFLSEDHHDQYNVSKGLEYVCAVCVPVNQPNPYKR